MTDADDPTLRPTSDTTPRVPSASLTTRVVGKYRLDCKLGAGGMGEVWKAWDDGLRRWVAIKLLKHTDPEEVARFRREAQTGAELNHPNIAAIYEVSEAAGRHFISMQFVDGQTLSTFPRHDVRRLVGLLRDAALAVQYAHERGIVHRDLKPANIMVEGKADGPGPRIYVMDFGLAKRVSHEKSLTASGMMIGTPAYMPPEQARGSNHEIDARSDVWSLGATFYELLAGAAPFKGDDVYSLLMQVIEAEPRRVTELNPRIDRDLETIVMKCLEKDPARRYATAREVADELTRYLAGEPIAARPASLGYRAWKRIRRHRALTLAIVGASVIGVSFAVYAMATSIGRRNERTTLENLRRATATFKDCERDLLTLRLRTYRSDWRLTDVEFASYQKLIDRCSGEMALSGGAAAGWWVIGRAHHVLGNPSAARDAYDRGLRIDPANGWCLLYKARILMEQSLQDRFITNPQAQRRRVAEARAREAVAILARARRSDEIPRIEFDIAEGYRRVICSEDAREYCAGMLTTWRDQDFREEFLLILGLAHSDELLPRSTEALAKRPGFYEALLWRAMEKTSRSDREGAIADATRAVEINPRYAPAWLLRAFLRRKRGDLQGALEDYDRALRIDPLYADLYSNRANARVAVGDLDGAMADLDELVRLEPGGSEALTTRASLRLMRKDLAGALADLDEAIRLDGAAYTALVNRGLMRKDAGELAGARSDFDAAIRASPTDNVEALVARAYVRSKTGDFDGARADLDLAVSVKPPNRKAFDGRGRLRHLRGDLKGALEDFDAALRLGAPDADLFYVRGKAKFDLGDKAGAAADYSEALTIDSTHPEARFNRGVLRQNSGDLQGALEEYDQLLSLHPDHARGRFSRGTLKDAMGDAPGAIEDLTRAIDLEPTFIDSYVARGYVRSTLKDVDGAIRDYTEALRRDPGCEGAYNARGITYKARGELDRAIADFDEALKRNPQSLPAYVNRGNARRAKGDRAGAAADYGKALDLAPKDWPHRSRVEKDLKSVQ